MKVGDIKIEALRLMFAGVPALMNADNLYGYESRSEFELYLSMMPGSIHRCIDNIVSRCILPVKRKELSLTGVERRGRFYRFDISGSDFYEVSRVIKMSEDEYDGDHPYRMEGETLVLLAPDEASSYTLLYHPKIPHKEYKDTDELVGIPDEIAVLMPYFIKGELYREDEAGEAAEAMSWFEQRLASLGETRTEKQGSVACLYDQGVL